MSSKTEQMNYIVNKLKMKSKIENAAISYLKAYKKVEDIFKDPIASLLQIQCYNNPLACTEAKHARYNLHLLDNIVTESLVYYSRDDILIIIGETYNKNL